MEEKLNPRWEVHINRLMFWLLATGGVAAILLVVVLPLRIENRQLSTRIAGLRNRRLALEQRIGKLKKEKRAALYDPFYAEALARTQLYLRKPGEEILPVKNAYSPVLSPASQELDIDSETVPRSPANMCMSSCYRWVGFVLAILSLIAALCLFGQEGKKHSSAA